MGIRQKNNLLYRNKQEDIFLMSGIEDLSYHAYVEVAREFLTRKPVVSTKASEISSIPPLKKLALSQCSHRLF